MSVDLKDSLFRFVVPPCIFWTISYFFSTQFFDLNIKETSSINIIVFIASGFVIAALGTTVAWIIEKIFEPAWFQSPFEYWRNIAKEPEYVRGKIETVWRFYTMNLNSVVAIVFALLFHFYQLHEMLNLGVFLVLILFSLLSLYNYRKNTLIAKDLNTPNPHNQSTEKKEGGPM